MSPIADLDRDGLADVLVCDAFRDLVAWIRQAPRGTFTEQTIAGVVGPGARRGRGRRSSDGDLDLLVAALGFLSSQQHPRRRGRSSWRTTAASASRPARWWIASRASPTRARRISTPTAISTSASPASATTTARPAGSRTPGAGVRAARAAAASGGINTLPADFNGDGRPDLVSLISQEWEEIWAFVNAGSGRFTPRLLWGATNPDFGSSWLSVVDLDRDGDPDLLYANGDAFEYAPPNSRPWQGIQWLENRGKFRFEFHRW